MDSKVIVDCFCMWSDLLGFGRAFEEGGWNLNNDKIKSSADRIRSVEHHIFKSNSPTKEYVLLLNDGIARNYDWDLQPLTGYLSGVINWFEAVLINHWSVNATESARGQPGMRSVLCIGQRMTLRDSTKTSLSQVIAGASMEDELARDISVYSPQQFQMNVAFSKAYLIESLGAKGGLPGPCLYIEDEVINGIIQICRSENVNMKNGKLSYHHEFIESIDKQLHILKGISGEKINFRLCFEVDSKPIEISHRGINTKVRKLLRYQPTDEADDFWFDFTQCRFEASPNSEGVVDPKRQESGA